MENSDADTIAEILALAIDDIDLAREIDVIDDAYAKELGIDCIIEIAQSQSQSQSHRWGWLLEIGGHQIVFTLPPATPAIPAAAARPPARHCAAPSPAPLLPPRRHYSTAAPSLCIVLIWHGR